MTTQLIHRRTFMGLSAAAILAAAGCVKSANAPQGGKAAASTDSVTMAFSEGGTTLDPAEANDVTSDTFVVAGYDQLVTYATDMKDGKGVAKTEEIVPMLAEKWDVAPDKATYFFTLRTDVTFQSGKRLTAKDVEASFKHIKESASASFLYKMASIASVTAQGDNTVEIKLERPNHLFLQIIAMYSFSIIDMDLVAKNGGKEWLKRNTAGSGPYRVAQWDPSTQAQLTVNDEYWGSKPQIGTVNLKFINEPSNRVQLLTKGEVELITEIPPKDMEQVKGAPGVTIDSRPSNKILFFAMNNRVQPFDDPRIRQAICYAIPYDKLLSDVMFGQAKRMESAVPSSMPGWTNDGYVYKYDLVKAKQLLAEAGKADGFSFEFTLGSGFPDWNDDAVLIQAELAKIGVKMEIKNMARAQFLEALGTKNVAAYISRWTSFVNDPGYHLGLLMATNTSSNYMNYTNSAVDQALQAAAKETDPQKREVLYAQAQKTITADAPWAYLYEYNIVIANSDQLAGYTSYPDGIIRFHQLSKKG